MTTLQDQVIVTRGLRKTFRDFWRRPTVEAVKGLDLTLRRGEVFGLLGPNGSGKTTTLKMLLGLLWPTAGRIEVFGASPREMRVKARLGYLPEVSCLHPFLTPRETLLYYAGLFGLPRREAQSRTEALLRMVDLAGVANRAVGSFSKGMARRVGLAQALINAPELLVLDEPTSGLDPVGSREIKDLVRMLARQGVTALMTSHLLADVEDICDRVAILDGGSLRAEGPVYELLRQPDTIRFEVEGLESEAAVRARAALEAAAERPVRQDYPAMSLETFFLNTVARDGRARVFEPAPFLKRAPSGKPAAGGQTDD